MTKRALFFYLFVSALDAANHWEQWRGPGGAGISTDENLPDRWSATGNITWKTEVPGRGFSSPIVWGDRVFLTTSIEGPILPGVKGTTHICLGQLFVHPDSVGADRSYQLFVLCFDANNGRMLWQRLAYEGPVFEQRHKSNSYATPTPLVDGERVYAYFGSEGLYAYDLEGNLKWKMSPGNLPALGIGVAGSPAMDRDRIFLQCDLEERQQSFVAAFDKSTGNEVWRTPRNANSGEVTAGWVSPLLVRGDKRNELVLAGSKMLTGYDPGTGKELWHSTKGVLGIPLASPVAGLGMVFASAGVPDKRVLAVPLGRIGEAAEKWIYSKGAGYVPSPILYGDFLYVMNDHGLLTCLDARTGNPVYEGRRPPEPGDYLASPVAFAGKIFITNTEGDTFVIQAGREHGILRRNSLGEPVYASFALAAGSIFIRTERHLYRIGGTQRHRTKLNCADAGWAL
jgi:outer membrane protein assembly factor BamB